MRKESRVARQRRRAGLESVPGAPGGFPLSSLSLSVWLTCFALRRKQCNNHRLRLHRQRALTRELLLHGDSGARVAGAGRLYARRGTQLGCRHRSRCFHCCCYRLRCRRRCCLGVRRRAGAEQRGELSKMLRQAVLVTTSQPLDNIFYYNKLPLDSS